MKTNYLQNVFWNIWLCGQHPPPPINMKISGKFWVSRHRQGRGREQTCAQFISEILLKIVIFESIFDLLKQPRWISGFVNVVIKLRCNKIEARKLWIFQKKRDSLKGEQTSSQNPSQTKVDVVPLSSKFATTTFEGIWKTVAQNPRIFQKRSKNDAKRADVVAQANF